MKKSTFASLLSALFLIVIFVPLFVMLATEDKKISTVEKRKLATMPELSITGLENFPRPYEDYVNDHFGLREQFVNLYNRFFIALFGSSPHPGVVVGNEKWLFLSAESVVEDYMGLALPGDNQLRHWKQVLLDRKEWLDSQGVKYLFILAPNKIAVYPEYLPERIRTRKGESRLERFLKILAAEPKVAFAPDLLPALVEAKDQGQLYLKGDTHWNFDGSYVAYQVIMKNLQKWFPDLQPVKKDAMKRESRSLSGDLSLVLNMGEFYREETSTLSPPHADSIVYQPFKGYPQPPTRSQKFRAGHLSVVENPAQTRTALFISDSFGSALRNYMTSHFGRTIFVRDARFEDMKRLIEIEQPEVVIDLNVARGMHVALNENLEIRDWVHKRRQEDSEILYELSPGKLSNNRKLQFIQLALSGKGENTFLRATGPDPQVFVYLHGQITTGTTQLQCQITSPADTTFRIFYQTPERAGFNLENSFSTQIRRGENFVSFRVYNPIVLDQLRIDPGEVPGDYRLEAFSIIAENKKKKSMLK